MPLRLQGQPLKEHMGTTKKKEIKQGGEPSGSVLEKLSSDDQ